MKKTIIYLILFFPFSLNSSADERFPVIRCNSIKINDTIIVNFNIFNNLNKDIIIQGSYWDYLGTQNDSVIFAIGGKDYIVNSIRYLPSHYLSIYHKTEFRDYPQLDYFPNLLIIKTNDSIIISIKFILGSDIMDSLSFMINIPYCYSEDIYRLVDSNDSIFDSVIVQKKELNIELLEKIKNQNFNIFCINMSKVIINQKKSKLYLNLFKHSFSCRSILIN